MLLLLLACQPVCLPRVGVAMTVCTLDGELPVGADRVTWSRPVEDAAYDGEHDLECADRACTIWFLTEVEDGTVIITGSRTDSPTGDTSCELEVTDTRQVALDPNQRQVMDMPLAIEGACP